MAFVIFVVPRNVTTMKLGLFTPVFGKLSTNEMLAKVKALKRAQALELGTGDSIPLPLKKSVVQASKARTVQGGAVAGGAAAMAGPSVGLAGKS